MVKEILESRTKQSMKNARYSLVFLILSQLTSFFYRSAFITNLGDDVAGLNSTLISMIGFLTLSELGIAFVVSFSLYSPLAKKDYETVNEILSLQGWIYRFVFLFILAVSVILVFFFPSIFAGRGVPMWYAYTTFGVLLFGLFCSYFFNYQQVLFASDQKQYKIVTIFNGLRIIKQTIQILCLIYLPLNIKYVSWLVIEVVNYIVLTLLFQFNLKKSYKWLHIDLNRGKEVCRKYGEIFKKTGQAIFHKVSYVLVVQSSPLILLALFKGQDGLILIALYGNYYLLEVAFLGVLDSLFGSTLASLGNLASEGNMERLNRVYRRIFALQTWAGAIVTFGVLCYSKSFMILWLGGDRYFTELQLYCFSIYFFFRAIRSIDLCIHVLGMFQDIYAPIIEGVLSVGLSLLLGYLFGLEGVFIGMLISMLIIIYGWKPYFLYKEGLHLPLRPFLSYSYSVIVIMLALIFGAYYLFVNYFPSPEGGIINFIKSIVSVVPIFVFISGAAMFIFKDFREGVYQVLVHFSFIRNLLGKRNGKEMA